MSPRTAGRVLKIGGALLVVLGILHLAVTPIIGKLITDNVTPSVGDWLTPPMLLNHVVVGILLLPLGVITFYAAPFAARGEKWARVVTRTTAVTVATLPVVLFALMGSRYFEAVPFLAAAIVVCVAALLLVVAAFFSRPGES
jgi:phosphoglycerol transferase MdoB-like AlkP superfamily enzyme